MYKLLKYIIPAFSALLVFACKSIDMPKETSENYSSYQHVSTDFVALELDQKILISLDKSLQMGGLKKSDNAELIVAFMVLRQDQASTSMNDSYFGNNRDALKILDLAHKNGVIDKELDSRIEQGAIVIDILDVKKNRLIYRNYAKRKLKKDYTDEETQQMLDSVVSEALADFFKN